MTATLTPVGDALLPVYGRRDAVFAAGMGSRLFAEDGREFLDFTSGIGVNSLGYGHPAVTDALQRAASTGLIHVSNLFRTGPGAELADFLSERSFGGSVFFANSGAEATEAALKFARRAAPRSGQTGFVALRGGFHGRTFGALAVTDRPAIQRPFEPLMPGATFLEPGADDGTIARTLDPDRVAAVIVEPIQGEGGVLPLGAGFLRALRNRCDETGIALIFDEIQCGLGRTGSLFAYEQTGVVPDILLLAKPLASGFPMGATLVSPAIAEKIRPGDHATTFGGGPFVSTVALATVKTIADPQLLNDVVRRGEQISARLRQIAADNSNIIELRGRGLMWGIQTSQPASDVVDRAFDHGLLVLSAGANVVRLLPPLVISEREVNDGLSVLADALR